MGMSSWSTALRAITAPPVPAVDGRSVLPCAALGERCTSIVQRASDKRQLRCKSHDGKALECALTTALVDADSAHAVILPHVGISDPALMADGMERMRALLWPPERSTRRMVWAMGIQYEPTTYYPAGADPAVVANFDYVYGFRRSAAQAYRMAQVPDWNGIMRPLNMTAKEELGSSLRHAPLVWVASNCNSKSGREVFVRGLMEHVGVDSFGLCLNNRDAGEFGMKRDGSNWNEALKNKHLLLSAYKFALVVENSLEEDYVSEKVFDAWEAGAVPLYLGAPNIEDYVPGPNAFIDLRNMTHAEVGALVRRLDASPTDYSTYHAWRAASPERIRYQSPLGRLFERHEATDPLCDVCRMAHARRRT